MYMYIDCKYIGWLQDVNFMLNMKFIDWFLVCLNKLNNQTVIVFMSE